MKSPTKKLQHFVPRFYLRAWSKREKIYCLQDGVIRNPNIKGVGAENYFYEMKELTADDEAFLRGAIINDSPEGLKTGHEELLKAFSQPFRIKRELLSSGLANPEALSLIDQMIAELNDGFHTGIEDSFRPYLAKMLNHDLTFLADAKQCAEFYSGLASQYARTNHIRRIKNMHQSAIDRFRRVEGPLVHILAVNVGFRLYVDRNVHTIKILDNRTSIPFITADQPVVNMAANPRDYSPPSRFELYYPLSPTRAMVLLDKDSDFDLKTNDVSEIFVKLSNLRMAAMSYRQVFASSAEVLESVKSDLPAYLSCFPKGKDAP